jgi:para-nitrobenzyl esterase
MKTKFYFLLFCAIVTLNQNANAQACGARYKDQIFSAVTKTANVTFSTANSTTLKLDVYEPTGDTAAMRPLIVLAHGGSFYGGDKNTDGSVVALCNNFAKRGYVTASINYRLGDAISMYLDSAYAVETVLKALSDGKSAIRFFRKDAATTNTYRINPDIIFVGGNSAGAVLYMHSIYVDSLGELTPFLQTIINNNGGFEGNSGNDGYSSEALALINLAGGINVPEFVGPGNKPSVNFQGTVDNTVPYSCDYPINGAVKVRLCGLGALEPLYTQYNIPHVSVLFPGDGHCPWDGSAPKFAHVDTTTRDFLYNLLCGQSTSVSNITADASVSLYPNPASSEINITAAARISTVTIFNNVGQLVARKNVETTTGNINTDDFAKGIYYVKVEFADKNITSVTRKVVVE